MADRDVGAASERAPGPDAGGWTDHLDEPAPFAEPAAAAGPDPDPGPPTRAIPFASVWAAMHLGAGDVGAAGEPGPGARGTPGTDDTGAADGTNGTGAAGGPATGGSAPPLGPGGPASDPITRTDLAGPAGTAGHPLPGGGGDTRTGWAQPGPPAPDADPEATSRGLSPVVLPRPAGSAPQAAGADAPPPTGKRWSRALRTAAALTVAFALGAAASGGALFGYYQHELNGNTRRVNALVDGYKRQFARAEADLRSVAAAGRAQIQSAATADRQGGTAPSTQQALVRSLTPSLFVVMTSSTAGQPSVGTAFVVASSATESLLLTSYTTVQAATTIPGPRVEVRPASGSGRARPVTVRTWDPTHDLAVLVLPVGNLPVVRLAPAHPGPQLGQSVFAVSALGANGGAIAAGEVDDVSSSGIADDIPIGAAYQGAPIVDSHGAVVAVASRSYAPLGVAPGGIWYAPFVGMACDEVLNCPGGSLGASR